MLRFYRSSLAAALAIFALATLSLSSAKADPIWSNGGGSGVPTSRTVSTSAPLGGGGALSGDLTLTCATCVTGAASSTDNAIARYDGTTGKGLQNSGVVIDDSDRLGLGTVVPTHTLTLGSTATGAAHYNTVDQATNYERGRLLWSSNVFTLATEAGGSGTVRSARLASGNNSSLTLNTAGVVISSSGGNSSTPVLLIANDTTFISTSAVQTGFSVIGTVNQASGTGGYNGYLCGPTLTAVGSAGAKCFRAAPGGVDRWWVDSNGAQDSDSTITAAATTGNQTINKPSGTVNIAAAGTSVTVTNSLVTANTILSVVARTNDSTCAVKNYVPAAGSFVVNMTAGCTAETSVGFAILDKN
jgi:hypothetical protein